MEATGTQTGVVRAPAAAAAEASPGLGVCLGLFMVSAATLLLELTLTRIFDTILSRNFAYLMVSSALFGFGLGGVVLLRWPMAAVPTPRLLALGGLGFAAAVLLIFPAIFWLPLELQAILEQPVVQVLAFGALYLFILAPFVGSGIAIAAALARHPRTIYRLYAWDLVGAGIGCLGVFVLPPLIGAEETLLVVAALAAAGAVAFAGGHRRLRGIAVLCAGGFMVAAVGLADRIEFPRLVVKRGVGADTMSELSVWDRVAKMDVIATEAPFRKRIAFDGGSQSSSFHRFDGDLAALRRGYFAPGQGYLRYNTGKYIALSHWLKRDQGTRVLVIGSAGGQETLAALVWGAAHVDGVDLVCSVIQAGLGPYAEFIGHIFSDPRVSMWCDEGRSFLRHSAQAYDIIQMHSNHTTSAIANGSGGALPIYLLTLEAFEDYFTHLTPDGILQINFFVYPRLLTTAARAWHELYPESDFRDHLVITTGFGEGLPTFMVKRSPWSAAEVGEVRRFLSPEFPDNGDRSYKIIYAPGTPEAANVPDALFQVPLDPAVLAAVPYHVEPTTDDKPFFRDFRKGLSKIPADAAGFAPASAVDHMNASLRGGIPLDHVHIYGLGGFSVLVAVVLLLVPLFGFKSGVLSRPEGYVTLLYFACLGVGFVVVELVLIFKFMLLVGPPVYAMAIVVFTMLVAAGLGSALSDRAAARWGRGAIAVLAVFALGLVVAVLAYPALSRAALGLPLALRVALVGVLILPIGLPLGMPFPLGLAALARRSPDLVPWAWGINAFTTVVGSLLSVVLSMWIGFDRTLLATVPVYALAVPCYLFLTRRR